MFVPINGDLANEPDEHFSVNLSNSTGVVISDPNGLGTITDDDVPATLSVSDQRVGEGNTGTLTTASFLVTLSQPTPTPVTVGYSTADGTATALGLDYATADDQITLAPGDTSATIDISVIGDNLPEAATENFTVTLANPVGARISDGTATGSIIDDEGSPVVSARDATSIAEGDTGTTAATFELKLSHASLSQVSVDYATAAGTATSAIDYEAIPPSTLDFPAGTTTRTVTVQVVGDVTDEADELFTLELRILRERLTGTGRAEVPSQMTIQPESL
ncbi:hypothetical protein BH18ACT16_BH18ACT16_13510 [soil metagenome]